MWAGRVPAHTQRVDHLSAGRKRTSCGRLTSPCPQSSDADSNRVDFQDGPPPDGDGCYASARGVTCEAWPSRRLAKACYRSGSLSLTASAVRFAMSGVSRRAHRPTLVYLCIDLGRLNDRFMVCFTRQLQATTSDVYVHSIPRRRPGQRDHKGN